MELDFFQLLLTSNFVDLCEAVSSKMLHVITPSFPVESSNPSTSDKVDLAALEIDEDAGMGSGNLYSTLHKLYLWEKKLYEEVKVC